MSSGSISFGGQNSGLNTDKIINKLLQIEAKPIRRYKKDINEAQTTQDAFKSLNSTVGKLESPSSNLTDPITFQEKKASSSNSDVLGASVVDSEKATSGTNNVFVEQLAQKEVIESGQFINNQKMVDNGHVSSDGDAATSISDFEVVEGSGTLDTSSDYLSDLSKEVQTSDDNTHEFSITVDTGGADQFSIDVDLDEFSDFQSMMDSVNNKLASNDPTGNQRLEMRYDQSRDAFMFTPIDSSDEDGGPSFALEDNEAAVSDNSKTFLQQIGITTGTDQHDFTASQDELQVDSDGDGTLDTTEPQNLLSISPDETFDQNLFSSPLSGNSGTITINNTDIAWDSDTSTDDPSTVSELVDEINSEVEGIRASYSSGTDKITLETEDKGNADIAVSDASGNLADVLSLRESGDDSDNQESQTVLKDGQDAVIELNNTKIKDSSNTITRDGIQYDLKGLYQETNNSGDPIEVDIDQDTSSITSDVEEFVSNFNKTIGFINEKSQTQPAEEPGGESQSGPLAGDSLSRGIKNTLTRMVSSRYNEATSGNDIQSLADVGIELKDPLSASDKNKGKLNFDKGEFKEALNNNPQQVRELFTAEEGDSSKGGAQDGVAVQVNNYIEGTTGSTGVIGDRIDGFDSTVNRLNERIEEQKDRVESKRERLEAKFRRMESTLRQLQEQQGFLGRR